MELIIFDDIYHPTLRVVIQYDILNFEIFDPQNTS